MCCRKDFKTSEKIDHELDKILSPRFRKWIAYTLFIATVLFCVLYGLYNG